MKPCDVEDIVLAERVDVVAAEDMTGQSRVVDLQCCLARTLEGNVTGAGRADCGDV